MIYLDYAANTPTDDKVLKSYVLATKKYWANPNSIHPLGKKAKLKIDKCSENIASYFKANRESVIYTSGSSESNNLVIKGVALKNQKYGKKIIISEIEHSSIIAPCNYLISKGFDVVFIPLTKEGQVDLEKLKKEINDETILVSICSVDSELGTVQPIQEIVKIVSNYHHCSFHTDATQAIGKVNINYDGVDFITFAPHKFYGINGVGVLLNRYNKVLVPLIQGGKSTTKYRSGTPVIANVVATDVALNLAIKNLDKRYKYIEKLNEILKNYFSNISSVHINSSKYAVPNTLNISVINLDAHKIVKKLAQRGIYLSTTSACSLSNMPSRSVYALTKDKNLARNSIRISLSHLTTRKEINDFMKIFSLFVPSTKND
jgi:cysteine desulfurase